MAILSFLIRINIMTVTGARFGDYWLGTEAATIVPHPNRAGRSIEELLWTTFAFVDDTSPNFSYSIRILSIVVKGSRLEFIKWNIAERANLGTTKKDLYWHEDVTKSADIKFPNCRFDELVLPDIRDGSQHDFGEVSWVFSSSQDGEDLT